MTQFKIKNNVLGTERTFHNETLLRVFLAGLRLIEVRDPRRGTVRKTYDLITLSGFRLLEGVPVEHSVSTSHGTLTLNHEGWVTDRQVDCRVKDECLDCITGVIWFDLAEWCKYKGKLYPLDKPVVFDILDLGGMMESGSPFPPHSAFRTDPKEKENER